MELGSVLSVLHQLPEANCWNGAIPMNHSAAAAMKRICTSSTVHFRFSTCPSTTQEMSLCLYMLHIRFTLIISKWSVHDKVLRLRFEAPFSIIAFAFCIIQIFNSNN